MNQLGLFFREAVKNIRTNLVLNIAIVALIISVMTFLGIVAIQVQVSDVTADVVMKQEAFVEYSQYRFITDMETLNRINLLVDINTGEAVPEEDVFLHYPLSKDAAVNMQYISNCDRFWDFMRKLRNIPGLYIETVVNVGYNPVGSHDAYVGHYTYDSTRDYAVTLDFFDIEQMTFLSGRAPTEDDLYIDDDGIWVVPIVVGYRLRDYFELGDIVEIKGVFDKYDPDDPKDRIADMHRFSRGRVVGILEPSNTLLDASGNHFRPLYDSIIRVIKYPSPDDFPELKSSDDVYAYVTFRKLTGLFTVKLFLNRTNEEQAAEEIRRALADTGIGSLYSIAKCDGYSKITAALEKGRTETYLQVALCVGLLSVFGLGLLTVMMNVSNAKDYAIHRLAGATKHCVALMATVQMLILLLVSDVLIHYPYLLSKTGLFLNGDSMLYIFSSGRKIYIVIAVLNAAVLLLTYVISRIFAEKMDVSATIKDKE